MNLTRKEAALLYCAINPSDAVDTAREMGFTDNEFYDLLDRLEQYGL